MESALSTPLAVAAVRKKGQDIGSGIPNGNDLSTWLERVKRQRKKKTQCSGPSTRRHVLRPSNASSDVSSQSWSTDSSRLGPRSSTYTANTTRTSVEDGNLVAKDAKQSAVTSSCQAQDSTARPLPATTTSGAQEETTQGTCKMGNREAIGQKRNVAGDRTAVVEIQRQLSTMERLQLCTTATYERMKADPSGSFTQEEQKKLQKLSLFLCQHSIALFRGRRLPEIVLSLVKLQPDETNTTTGSKPNAAPLICIKGLSSDKEIADVHLVLSTRPVKSQYSPLRLCYDRSLISHASFQVLDGEHQLHRLYDSTRGTASGGVLVCAREAKTWISTVGGLIEMGGQYFLLAGSSHKAAGPPNKEEQELSYLGTVDGDDLDDDIHPPLVLDLRQGAIHPTNNNSVLQRLTRTATLGSRKESRLSCEEGGSWYLVPAMESSGFCLPNFIRVPADIQPPPASRFGYIRHYRTELEGCPVLINSGMSGVLPGTLFGSSSYIVSGPMLTEVRTIDLKSGKRAQQGDSGSWVLDYQFQLLGSITAISSDGCTYMIPIKTQLDEIQRSKSAGHTHGQPSIADPLMLMLHLSHFHFLGEHKRRSKFYAEQAIDIARAIGCQQSRLHPTSPHTSSATTTKANILGMSISFLWNSLRTTEERSELIGLLSSTGKRILDNVATAPPPTISPEGSRQSDSDHTSSRNGHGFMMRELANIYNSNPMHGSEHGGRGTVYEGRNAQINNHVLQTTTTTNVNNNNNNEPDQLADGARALTETSITRRVLNLTQWAPIFILGVIITQSPEGGLQNVRPLLPIAAAGVSRIAFGLGGSISAALFVSRNSTEITTSGRQSKPDTGPSTRVPTGMVLYTSWVLAMVAACIGCKVLYSVIKILGKLITQLSASRTPPNPPKRKPSPSETATTTTTTTTITEPPRSSDTRINETITARTSESKNRLRTCTRPKFLHFWGFTYALILQPLTIVLVVPWLVLEIFYAMRWRDRGYFGSEHKAWWPLVCISGAILLADSVLVRILFLTSRSLSKTTNNAEITTPQHAEGEGPSLSSKRPWRLFMRRSRKVRQKVNGLIVVGIIIAALRCTVFVLLGYTVASFLPGRNTDDSGKAQATDIKPNEFVICGVIFAVGDSVGMFLAVLLLGLTAVS